MFSKTIDTFRSRHLALIVYVSGFFLYPLIPAIRNAENTQLLLILHTFHALCGIILLRHYSEAPRPTTIALIFILTRLAVFGMYPWLSDDVFGYLFYGKATLHGANLYAITADHPSLLHLRDSAFDLMAFQPYHNIYPPIATMFMTLSAWITSAFPSSLFTSFWIWKTLLLICEGFGLWILYVMLKKSGQSLFPIFLYLAIPLTALEGIGQAHNELLLIPILAGILTVIKHAKGNAYVFMIGTLCALAGLIKLYPIVLLIPIMIQTMTFKQSITALSACLLTIIVSAMPWFYGIIIGDFSAVIGYASVLSFYNGTYFNGMVLYLFRWLFETLSFNEWWLMAPKAVSTLRAFSIIGMSILGKVRNHALTLSLYLVLLITVFISPKVHAWYFIPVIFIGSIHGFRSLPLIACIMILTYAMYAIEPAQESLIFEGILWLLMGITYFWEYNGTLQIFNRDQGKVLA
jgi:hypothetical protein